MVAVVIQVFVRSTFFLNCLSVPDCFNPAALLARDLIRTSPDVISVLQLVLQLVLSIKKSVLQLVVVLADSFVNLVGVSGAFFPRLHVRLVPAAAASNNLDF
jgi:hypothetical protein